MGRYSLATRAVLALLILTLLILAGACANIAKVSDETIPRLVTPLSEADFSTLVQQLQPLMNYQSLRSSRVSIQFIDAESAERYRTADAQLVLRRPDKIRLIVQLPVAGTKIAEMVSQDNQFRVAIYRDPYKRFLVGTNNADYSQWRAKLGGREKQSALINARPFHFTDALLIRPLHLGETQFVYSLEEALVEEPDLHKGAKKGARLLRSFYVISELGLPATGQGPTHTQRRFWFDRTDQVRLARQQIFDERGTMATEVFYSNYLKLNPESPQLWPGVVLVMRPHDNYSARLIFREGGGELNPPDLPESAFVLENKEGLPETNLDKP